MEKRNTDPGWNDPPTFSYTESKDLIKSPKRNLLNKRVAYPVHCGEKKDTTTTPVKHLNSDLPPLPLLVPPPESSNVLPFESNADKNVVQCDLENTSSGIDPAESESMLREILANINRVMEDKDRLLQNQSTHEQIRKKIHTMEEAWKSKLTSDVKKKILQLSIAMKELDKKKANEIQASLMVDYPKLCCEFISAFRMLINVE